MTVSVIRDGNYLIQHEKNMKKKKNDYEKS